MITQVRQSLKYLVIVLFIGASSVSCTDRGDSILERIKQDGKLIVVTRNSPTTYYKGPHGEKGLEYELTRRFARYLGVSLQFIVPEKYEEILPLLVKGKAHIAAAGLVITEKSKKYVKYGPVYQNITHQVVYRLGTRRPTKIEHILNSKIKVMSGSAHADRLRQLKKRYSKLQWQETREKETEEIMDMVWRKKIEYTIADSNEVAVMQRYYPELRVGFELNKRDKNKKVITQKLAWAFPKNTDNSLYHAAIKFFRKLQDRGELEQVRERYYGHVEDQFNYWRITTIKKHIKVRLQKYKRVFKREAKKKNLDWRLLAAIGYQESHWDPNAKSPTGVRGIMMLTLGTARHMRIRNRLDPTQSITGGSRYFRFVKDRISIQVSDPDRTWFALAAYNVGIGHLQDAQLITRERGGDPYKWIDVRQNLPLLTKKKWYMKTRYGYARGYEPVIYVRNIRRFYDLLVRYDEEFKQSLSDVKRKTRQQIKKQVKIKR